MRKGELVTICLGIDLQGYPELTLRFIDGRELDDLFERLAPEYEGRVELVKLTEQMRRLGEELLARYE